MAYPITCLGGFTVPARAGKFEVTGFCAAVSTLTAASSFAIVDDPEIKSHWEGGRLLASIAADQKGVLAYIKEPANGSGNLSYEFAEPIKTRYGISILADNLVIGSICVYRR